MTACSIHARVDATTASRAGPGARRVIGECSQRNRRAVTARGARAVHQAGPARVPDLWAAPGDSDGQWRALRHQWDPRALPALRLVDAVGDSASAHSTGPVPTKRGACWEISAREETGPPQTNRRPQMGPRPGGFRLRSDGRHDNWSAPSPTRDSQRAVGSQGGRGHACNCLSRSMASIMSSSFSTDLR